MRLAVLAALLAGCADDPSFVYTVEMPMAFDATFPVFTVEGHRGDTVVHTSFDSYEQARDELSLNVTLEDQGTTTSRQLQIQCGPSLSGGDVGRLESERVHLGTWGTPPSIIIDSYVCQGSEGGFAISDCGC